MTKPEWGEKRTCPKCSTRFYDLGNADPITCIECSHTWVSEPILKAKQSAIRGDEQASEKRKGIKGKSSDDEDDDDLDLDLDLDLDDDDNDDETLVDVSLDDEDSDVNEIVDVSLVKDDE